MRLSFVRPTGLTERAPGNEAESSRRSPSSRGSPSRHAPPRSRARSPSPSPAPPRVRVRRRARSARKRARRARSGKPSPSSATSISIAFVGRLAGRAGSRPRRGAARCRPGFRAPGRAAAGRRTRARRRPRRRGSRGPARRARSAKRCRVRSSSSRDLDGSGRTGSRPSAARAISSRSSASWARWSRLLERGDERLAHVWVVVRRSRSAASSSALRTASGVRSSWLASATNRRSRSNESSQPGEHLVERLAEPADLVVRVRQRQPLAPAVERDPLRPPAHRLDRARGPPLASQ